MEPDAGVCGLGIVCGVLLSTGLLGKRGLAVRGVVGQSSVSLLFQQNRFLVGLPSGVVDAGESFHDWFGAFDAAVDTGQTLHESRAGDGSWFGAVGMVVSGTTDGLRRWTGFAGGG